MKKNKKWLVSLILTIMAVIYFTLYGRNKGVDDSIRLPNIVLIMSDDQSWKHVGINGDSVVKTPYFDLIAKSGVNFTNAYSSAPACAPSRASMLTGLNFWELGTGAIHFSDFPPHIPVFTELIAQNGYEVGYTGKAWGPGNWKSTREADPSGTRVQNILYSDVPEGINSNHYAGNFKSFHQQIDKAPFFFWLGTTEPHRPMAHNKGVASGIDLDAITIPGFLPDSPIVRNDIADYYYEIYWLDKQIGEVYEYLKEKGELENTVFIITSDNGMPFPRAKSNLYDYGTRLPLAISFPGVVKGNRILSDFVNLKDLAPTILELAQTPVPDNMKGNSLMPLLLSNKKGRVDGKRDYILMGKELHGWCQPEGEINPVRAIRTDKYLYIRNLKPDMWPAGHPNPKYSWDLESFGDVDASPSKSYLLNNKDNPQIKLFYDLAFDKRPVEELYDIIEDPFQLKNLAYRPGFQEVKKNLANRMIAHLQLNGDPRIVGATNVFDNAPYYWSHGLETAGLPLYIWESLNKEERIKKIDSVSKEIGIK